MKLTILGSGTCMPHPHRTSPGYVLQTDSRTVLLECSDGTIQRLAILGIDPVSIDTILISHCHLDHIGGLMGLMMTLHVAGRTCPLELIGPTGFSDIMNSLGALFDDYGFMNKTPWLDLSYQRTVTEINIQANQQKVLSRPPVTITALRVDHGDIAALGFRIQSGQSVLSYSGDTGYCQNAVTICHEADLALVECAYPNEESVEGHLTPTQAANLAQLAKVKKLVLTHRYPICDEYDILGSARESFFGDVIMAEDQMQIDF